PIDQWIGHLVELGYVRATVEEPFLPEKGNVVNIEPKLAGRLAPGDRLAIVLDRLTTGEQSTERLRDSIESAFAAGNGACVVFVEEERVGEAPAEPGSSADRGSEGSLSL